MALLALLSPAKTLNFDDDLTVSSPSQPTFAAEASSLANILKKKSSKDIQKLMSVSEKIAALNVERNKSFSKKHTNKNARAALLAYRGDVYKGFRLDSYSKTDFNFSQKTLRIISGLYGILKPLDLIQPYRLEMKTKLKNTKGKDLYTFWRETLTEQTNKDISKHKIKEIINLASVEYSKSIDLKSLDASVVNIDFKVKKGRELKTIGIYAKKARGVMANYIVKERISSSKALLKFKEDGYQHKPKLSDSNNLVFVKSVSA